MCVTYKVDLDIYNGPMDLLLYLIRREEVDIRDIPIARIADQYIAYLELLQGLDIELAGDFIVMAATLLELKSRALLPRPPAPEEEEGEEGLEDPRETLIRQLLEYRQFKEAAGLLDDRSREMAHRFPRQVDEPPLSEAETEEIPAEFMKGIEVWDLISAFSQVMRTLGYARPREVIYDDVPVEEAAAELMKRLEAERSVLFTQLFAAAENRGYLVTIFLAILELARQRRIGFEQSADFKDFRLFLRDPATETVVQRQPKGARPSREAMKRKGPRRPSARQVESLRQAMDEPEIEKTEFDGILESIQVPEVEVFQPIYSEEELLGRQAAEDAEDAPAAPEDAPPPAPTGRTAESPEDPEKDDEQA